MTSTMTVNLNFTGICAFVRKGPYVDVILVDALNNSMGMETHVAALLVSRSLVDTSASSRSFSFGFDAKIPGYDVADRDYVAFLLDKEDFALNLQASAVTPATPETVTDCPGASNAFGWIARMADAGTDQFDANELSSHDDVLAHIQLTSGNLTTYQFSQNSANKILKWQFDKPAGGAASGGIRALADVIQLSISGLTPAPLHITSKTFNGMNLKDIVLNFDPHFTINAWVVNLPLLDIISNRVPANPGNDVHFIHFHRISIAGGGSRIPVLKSGDCGQGSTGGVLNPKCPPAYFSS